MLLESPGRQVALQDGFGDLGLSLGDLDLFLVESVGFRR